MPSDGALIIDTGINTSGFKRDSQNFRQSVEGLRDTVEKTGQKMAQSANSYTAALGRADKAAKDMANSQSAIQKEIEKTEAAITRLEARQEKMKALADQRAQKQREDLRAQMVEETKAAIGHGNWEIMPKWSQDQALEQTMRDFEGRLAAIQSAPVENTEGWRSLQYDIDKAREKLEGLKAQLEQSMSGGEDWIDRYRRAMDSWDGTAWRDADMRVKHDAASTMAETAAETERAAEAQQTLAGSARDAADGEEAATKNAGRLHIAMMKISTAYLSSGGGIRGAFAGIASAAGQALATLGRFAGNGAVGFLKKLAAGAKNAAIQLAKMAGNAIKGGMKKLGGLIGGAAKSMFGFNRAAKMADGGLKSSLMSVLKYGLGIRGLFALFRKLRTAVKEGFEAMAQSSPEVKGALDSLQGALNGLKGSLATAFAPILTAVAPALTTLINMLTGAINAVGAFMAALTGQKTYQAAVAGLEGVGGAASGAAGSVKDLKRQLAGFDQLNILSANQSGGGGGGGGGGAGSGLQYETQEISGGITDFVQKLKDLWANADYEGIGREIAGAINGAFEKAKDLISWDNLGAKITQAVNAITGIFNGLVDGIDWDLIGRTFGTGVNTILNTINQLLTKIDWANLGKKLAAGLNGLVDEVDWALLGETLGNRFKAALQVLGNFLSTFDWANLGKKLSEGINSLVTKISEAVDGIDWSAVGARFGTGVSNLFTGIDWEKVGATLAKYFNTALTVIQTTIQNFKFGEAGTALGKGVNKFIKDVNWAGIGETISNFFKGALDFITKAIEAVDWKQLGKDLATAISAIDWNGVADKLFEAIGAALGGIAAFLGGLLSDAFKGIKDYFNKSIEDAGGDVVAGIFNGIVNAIKGVGQWIVDHIFTPIIDGFKKAFGIASPAKTMEEPGENILLGIYEGIKAAIKGVGQWVKDNIFTPIWNAIKSVGETVITIAVSLVKKVGEWAADVWGVLTSAVETIVKTIKAGLNWASKIAETIITWISKGLETIAKTVRAGLNWASKIAETIITWISKGLETIAKTVQAGLNWASKIAETIITWISKGLETIVKTVQAGLNWASKIAETMFRWLEKGLETIVKTVQAGLAWASKIAETMFRWLAKGLETIVKTVQAGLAWASKIAETMFRWLQKGLETIAKTVQAGLNWASKIAETMFRWLQKGLETIAKTVQAGLNWASKIAETMFRWLQKGLETIAKTVQAGLNWASKIAETMFRWLQKGLETIAKTVKAGLNWVSKTAETIITWISKGLETIAKTVSAGMGWDSDTAEAIWNFISGAATITKDIIVNIIGNIDSWLASFLGINTAGESKKIANEDAGAMAYAQSHGVKITATVNGKAGTGIKSLGETNKLNGFAEGKVSVNGTPGDGFKKKLSGTNTYTLKGIEASSTKVNAEAGTGINSIGRTNKLNSFDARTVTINTAAGNWASGIVQWITGNSRGTVTATLNLVAGAVTGFSQAIQKIFFGATGGVVTANGVRAFASGGMLTGAGRPRWWDGVQKYASGTSRAHGTLFAAGEAGPEIIGHINGRTEILNKSQLASTMFSAVENGMLSALTRLHFRAPAMATGSILPYEVAAQIAATGERIETTLNANNEDLIQTIISVAGQIVAAIQRQSATPSVGSGGPSLQQIIDGLNRQTQMFGASPLKGV